MATWLVYGGKKGWVGQQVIQLLEAQGDKAVAATARLEYREAIEREIDAVKPTYIVNAAGKTGRPNIDWCETHKAETFRDNVIGALNLFDICELRNIPCMLLGTGCIYSYEKEGKFKVNSGIGFTEEDKPNFHGSYYSLTKALMDEMFQATGYKTGLLLRLRLPIGDDLNPRSLITKLLGYSHLVDIPNSVSVLHNLLPVAIQMLRDGRRGVYNFTNPGTLSHNEIMGMYRDIVDPTYKWKNFTEEEQNKIVLAKRSNNLLDTSKLLREYPQVKPAREALEEALRLVKKSLDDGTGPKAPPRPA